ncbi:MAG TPA: glycosyltransferase [Acidimicrobiales bacterium]|nr:glycosyltransferase [Acidimicrobiales bacterium]
MRVLFSSSSGVGHVQPMLPLALGMRARGHEVRWVTAEDGCHWVRGSGIDAAAAGPTTRERMAEYERRWPAYAALRGEARAEMMFPRLFGDVAAHAMFRPLLDIARRWQPELIVSEAADFASPVVAAAMGVPQVTHGFGLVVPRHRVELAGEMAGPLWREVGLEPRPFGGVYDHLYVDIYPPSMQPDDLSYIDHVTRRRPGSLTDGHLPIDAAVCDLIASDQRLVYVTFGTVFNRTPTFAAAVDALRSFEDIGAIVTVGPDGDVDAFGAMPDHVVVARYVSQDDVFPHASAVVSHAGSGTLLGALGHGVPQLCLPQAADQFRNADACAMAGAGIVLKDEGVGAEAVALALLQVLRDVKYRDAAVRVSEEIASMPAVDDVVTELEGSIEKTG